MDFKIIALVLTAFTLLAAGCAYDDNYRHNKYNRHSHYNGHGGRYSHTHSSYSNSRHHQRERYEQEGIDKRDWGRKIVLTPSMDEIWETYDPKPRHRKSEYSESDDVFYNSDGHEEYPHRTSLEEQEAKIFGFKNVEAWRRYKARKKAESDGL